MSRPYAPMTTNQAIAAATHDAQNHWGGHPPGGVHNCGNQANEYITFAQQVTVKQAWRNLGTVTVAGTQYTTVASDSDSGNGNEIDLKLRDAQNVTRFNYHIALDAQEVAAPPRPKIDNQKDAWRAMNLARKAAWREEHKTMTGYRELPFKEW